MLPFYLQKKLLALGISSTEQLKKHDYFLVFQWLRDIYPSIGYKALFDLYCLHHNQPFNILNSEIKLQLKQIYKSLIPHFAPLATETIDKFMQLALSIAKTENNEIPVGAVVVKNGEVIGRGYNQTITKNDITAHAEIIAIRDAAQTIGNYRLDDCDLYVTIEPCLMCAGAIINSRIRRVIFGAVEPKTGAINSQYKILNNIQVNRHTEAIGPIDNELYASPLKDFLSSKR
jgi:tRNA(Arg) A34 adenosine deaminase TadA